MKFVYHESPEDANFYLRNSLVKYGGEIVQVYSVHSDWRVEIGTKDTSCIVDYDELDLSPIPLGYVYSPIRNRTYYLERLPARQWRQGLTPGTVQDRMRNAINVSPSEDYIQALLDEDYPDVKDARDRARSAGCRMPFHRHFAVNGRGWIYHKGRKVGTYSIRTGVFRMEEPFHFLLPELEEVTNVNNRHDERA